ncbi:MAG TPA: VOC family protein [Casimicrobiaceae bacterium]|jgi:methylmalonyl-CoA/ethylmalonyl-CoA epimerase|nr:VOC family protein [Casimicrobiaceae bacterium]
MTPEARHLEFHHIGVACRDVDAEVERLAALGYLPEHPEFLDPVQGVRGRFMTGQSPRLELLEPLHGVVDGVLAPWLNQGIKLYHLAYLTPDLAAEIERLRSGGAKLMVKPVPAVAFGGREIAFLMLANGILIELISRD